MRRADEAREALLAALEQVGLDAEPDPDPETNVTVTLPAVSVEAIVETLRDPFVSLMPARPTEDVDTGGRL